MIQIRALRISINTFPRGPTPWRREPQGYEPPGPPPQHPKKGHLWDTKAITHWKTLLHDGGCPLVDGSGGLKAPHGEVDMDIWPSACNSCVITLKALKIYEAVRVSLLQAPPTRVELAIAEAIVLA